MKPTLINPDTTELLVLDVHGVIFNNPLPTFLHRLGERTGEGGDALLARWRHSIRTPFWQGRLDETDMWRHIAPEIPPTELRTELEDSYAPGPLFDLVMNWPNRLWILSNHRSDWLIGRLTRFGIDTRFEAVLVSDALDATKPEPTAFRAVQQEATRTSLLFIDDQNKNVTAARQLGITAEIVTQVTTTAPSAPDRVDVHTHSA